MDQVDVGGLRVAPVLHAFVNDEALPGTGIAPDAFWGGLGVLGNDEIPRGLRCLRAGLAGRARASGPPSGRA